MTRKKNKASKQATTGPKKEVIIRQVPASNKVWNPRMKTKSSRNPIFGSNLYVSNVDHIPVAFNTISGNSTFLREAGRVRHPMIGIEGISLVGCQPLTDIKTTASTSDLFTDGTLATCALLNIIKLSPDALNGPIAAQANLHSKFVFRDVIIEYISNVATSQAGSMALCITEDGAAATRPLTFSQTRQVVPSMTIPFRSDRAYLHYHYDGLELWFTSLAGSAFPSDERLCNQACISGFPSASSIGAISQGFTNIWYLIELYQPVQSQGISLLLRSTEEKEQCEEYLNKLRQEKKTGRFQELKPVFRN